MEVTTLTGELEKSTSDYAALEQTAAQLQESINTQLYEKQRQQAILDRKQRDIKNFMDLETGRIAPIENAEEMQFEIEKRVMVANANANKVKSIIGHLKNKFPHLDQVLERVGHLAVVEEV